MSQTRDSVSSIIIVVIFLVLTAAATMLYGGSPEQRARLNNNFFWQKTKQALDTALYVLISLPNLTTPSATSSPAATPAAPTPDFWSQTSAHLAAAWRQSGGGSATGSDLTGEALGPSDNGGSLAWERTATGATIIFRGSSGHEYKLDLPWRFLGR